MSDVAVRATVEDLYREPGKAELIDGRIVRCMATGYLPNRVAFRIARSLDDHSSESGRGVACTDSIAFSVPRLKSGRESFSPDASYYSGPLPRNPMRFVEGPPILAVEVRSEGSYTPAAQIEIADKRADYFESGTQVLWDVDALARLIRVYRATSPDEPVNYGPGDEAEAEPAVPEWRVAVDWIFA